MSISARLGNVALWNLGQRSRGWLQVRPCGCSGKHPGYEERSQGCGPTEVFACNICGRLMPWCMGAADDMQDACDDCWASAHREDEI